MTTSDMTEGPAGVDELPDWLRGRYRSKRHLAALVEIGRVLRGVGMGWGGLHRITEPPDEAVRRAERAAGRAAEDMGGALVGSAQLVAMIDWLEHIQPWPPTSSAPMFMEALRGMAARQEHVRLTPRQASWVDLLLERGRQMTEPPPAAPVQVTMPQPDEADTGNVVRLRPRARAL